MQCIPTYENWVWKSRANYLPFYACDLSYLWLCKDINGDAVERNAWAEYNKVSCYSVHTYWEEYKKRQTTKGKTVDELFSDETKERLTNDFNEYEHDYPYTKSSRNREWTRINAMIKRAQALDDTEKIQGGIPEKETNGFPDFSFEAEYIAIYKYTSEYAHGKSGAFQPLYETEGNVGSIIISVSDHANNVAAISLAANYMLILMYIIAHLNGFDLMFIPRNWTVTALQFQSWNKQKQSENHAD